MSIRKLQQSLKRLGLYHGKITSEANAALRQAIATYSEREMHDAEVDALLTKRAQG